MAWTSVRGQIDAEAGLTRRGLMRAAMLLPPGALLACSGLDANGAGGGEDAGWPAWAPTRASLYARLDAMARAEGRDLRSFGARMDGKADDTDAVERAVAAGVRVLLLPALTAGGAVRLTRQIRLHAPIAIIGAGDSSLIRWEGADDDVFLARPANGDPATFLTGIHLDRLRVVRPAPLKPLGVLLRGANLREVSVTRCSTERMGTLIVQHLRQGSGPKGGVPSERIDPAIAAGFSATRTDDLNERIFVYDNRVDAGSYMSHVVRFNFARQVAAVGNRGRFAKISWWGGGAKRTNGGAIDHLRRVRDVYITHNVLSGANGGVYGNNGDGIVVAYNEVSLMTDVGIDFEGCFNALAHHNSVRNVGNFCYATFYAARNVVFRDNLGYQDGGGTRLDLVFGKGRYGKMTGTTLFCQRSSGFGRGNGAIDVSVLDNHFVWAGKSGIGHCTPSYFDRLRVERNRFENVECQLAYRNTGELILHDNRLSFDRAAAGPLTALGSSAKRSVITDNVVRITAAQPAGSVMIRDTAVAMRHTAEIARNRLVAAPSTGPFPIVVDAAGRGRGTAQVSDNQADAIYALDPAIAKAWRNTDRQGKLLLSSTTLPT